MISVKKISKLKKYLNNILWQFGEKILLMIISFVVSVFVVRYLGSEQFGELQYINSILAFFNILTYLGLSGILIHEFANKPHLVESYMWTAFILKLFGGIVGFISLILMMFLTYGVHSNEFYLSIIIGMTLLIRPFDIISIFFDANIKAKYRVISTSSSSLITAFYRIILIITSAGVLYFGSAILLSILISTSLMIYFVISKFELKFKKFKFDFNIAKELLKKSWMLIFSAVFAVMYLKIDQIMLRWFKNSSEVGVYSVAVTLSETWYFIPTIIVVTIFPKLISIRKLNNKQYKEKLQFGYDVLFLIALFISILVSLIAHPIIDFLYGSEFSESANILLIHVWTGIFIFMRALFSKWLIMENLIKYSILTHSIGAIVNISLNLYFIPHYGGIGAAITSLISYAFSSYIVLFLSKETREQAIMMSKAFTSPFRLKSLVNGII